MNEEAMDTEGPKKEDESRVKGQTEGDSRISFNSGVLGRVYLIVLLLAALAMAFVVIRPFLNSIIIAGVLAIIFHPIHRWMEHKLGDRKSLAALVSLLFIVVCIILPALVFVSSIVTQGVQVTASIREWISGGGLQQIQQQPMLDEILSYLEDKIGFLDIQSFNIKGYALEISRKTSEYLLSQSASLLGNVASFFINFGIMLFILFYLLRDGRKFLANIKELSPLRESQEELIFSKIRGVTFSVLVGSLLTALLQGLVGGIGLAIVGIPALFWGTMMAFSSLVPVIGTALIWVPAAGYLLLMGRYKSAIFLLLWSALLVGSIDNFVRPFLMKGHGGMSTFTIFLAILGGLQIFGLLGLLYGPLVFGLALVMLALYQNEYCEELKEPGCDFNKA